MKTNTEKFKVKRTPTRDLDMKMFLIIMRRKKEKKKKEKKEKKKEEEKGRKIV